MRKLIKRLNQSGINHNNKTYIHMTKKQVLTEGYDILNYIRRYNGSYTFFNEVKSGLQLSKALNSCLTIEELIVAMKADKRFTVRDFAKLDKAIDHFLESKNHKKQK